MSANSLANLAVERDSAQSGTQVESALGALAAVIPTEALAAYTAVSGTVAAVLDNDHTFVPFRVAAYVAFVVAATVVPWIVFQRKRGRSTSTRRIPIRECASAMIAAAAWGAVMPRSPLEIYLPSPSAHALATTTITVTAALVLAVSAQRLGTANDRS